MNYQAFVVEETPEGFKSKICQLDSADLPTGEVLVRVKYSSLNYKDALSATGNKGITKRYPHTPGIDAAGIVLESSDPTIQPNDEVIVSGYDLGMNTAGGFAECIRVPAEWVVKKPDGLTLKEAMIIGTAGFTAAISVNRLRQLVKPNDGAIIVSGATGGVGSIALNMLSQLGYNTVALSGKSAEYDFLRSLGANTVLSREELLGMDDRPLYSAQYAGGIDTVGGEVLVRILKSTQLNGAVTTCGSVASTTLNLNVFPFILRAVTLIGISAQNFPTEPRREVWKELAGMLKPVKLMDLHREISLDELPDAIEKILQGKLKGRTLIRI